MYSVQSLFSPQFLTPASQTEIVRVSTEFFVAVLRDQEVIFEAEPAAARPINSWLDRQHHSFFHGSRSRLMRVRRLVRPCAYAVADRMRRLSGIASFGNASPTQPIQIRKPSALARVIDRFGEDLQEQIQEFVILRGQFPRAGIFREVGPVAVHAHPDFKQSRFILLDGTISGGREGCGALSRPYERDGLSHSDF